MEVHEDTDQILINAEGEGKVILDGQESPFRQNDLVFVHAGTWHNFLNTGSADLKIYTMYSPPHHAPGTVHKTKEEADAAEAAEGH
jgi:mannose-6-phosphate isomerase-like protein (cupin superfamily)